MYGGLFANYDEPEKGVFILKLVMGVLLSFFILLPTLNLINLNISRIMERSAEIGVRKAYGASSGAILFQFLFENIIITLMGGLIGGAFALLLIQVINSAGVFPYNTLVFNGRVFLYSLFIALGFGLISGLLPAWRVSRFQIADVLKSNQL
ncbi:MAG: FtsX-like permease family protein [Saprospiraceae bacterium]